MHKVALAVAAAVALIGPTPPAGAQVDPVIPPAPEPCIVPASYLTGQSCTSPRTPDRVRESACNLPVVYLGGRPGPCPEPEAPPDSRFVPILPQGVSR